MDAIQPIAAVVLVLTLLAGSLFFLKKRGAASFPLPGLVSRQSGQRRMEVIERLALGPQHALHMVRVGDRTLVVATAPSSCQLLTETDIGVDRI
jgi:flagellar biosynthetic protein FliO